MAAALELGLTDTDRLLIAGGYCPVSLEILGGRDPTLEAVTRVLVHTQGPALQGFRAVIGQLCEQWLRS